MQNPRLLPNNITFLFTKLHSSENKTSAVTSYKIQAEMGGVGPVLLTRTPPISLWPTYLIFFVSKVQSISETMQKTAARNFKWKSTNYCKTHVSYQHHFFVYKITFLWKCKHTRCLQHNIMIRIFHHFNCENTIWRRIFGKSYLLKFIRVSLTVFCKCQFLISPMEWQQIYCNGTCITPLFTRSKWQRSAPPP